MKIAIVANQDERCGLAEHGRGLAAALRASADVDEMIDCPVAGYDVVLINEQSGQIGVTAAARMARAAGRKVVVIMNDAARTVHISPDYPADAVVAHEPVTLVGSDIPVKVIEIGVSDIDELPEYDVKSGPSVGTAGFAFTAKRMDMAVRAAARIGGIATIIAPESRYFNPTVLYVSLATISYARLNLITDWLPQDAVVKTLAQCAMCMYFSEEDTVPGQSGSVRMILAAGRPTIVRRCARTKPLEAYEDEIYFVNNEDEALAMAEAIWNEIRAGRPVRRPSRVRQAISWTTIGQQYLQLIQDLLSN